MFLLEQHRANNNRLVGEDKREQTPLVVSTPLSMSITGFLFKNFDVSDSIDQGLQIGPTWLRVGFVGHFRMFRLNSLVFIEVLLIFRAHFRHFRIF